MTLDRLSAFANRIRGFEILVAAAAIVIIGAPSAEAQTAADLDRRATEFSDSSQTEFQARADQWGLTETEYQRYRDLMTGPRGSLSDPTITPIEVLGIEARSTPCFLISFSRKL